MIIKLGEDGMRKVTKFDIVTWCIFLLLSSGINAQNVPYKMRAACLQSCNTCDFLTATLDAIESVLEQPARSLACAATPISQFDFNDLSLTYTITQPGTYCLTETVAGAIYIDSSDVTLDLNGFSMISAAPSVICNQGCNGLIGYHLCTLGGCGSCGSYTNNITIKNGSVSGINIACCNGVQLLDINSSSSITLYSSSYVAVSNIVVVNPTAAYYCDGEPIGCLFYNCQYVQVVDSIFNSGGYGLFINGGSNFVLNRCTCNNNSSGFIFVSVSNIVVSHCLACNNGYFGFCANVNCGGFTVSNFLFDSCIAMNTSNETGQDGIGFYFTEGGSAYGVINNCNAVGNSGIGFMVQGDNITVSNCQSTGTPANNSLFVGCFGAPLVSAGFYGSSPSTHFYNNAACNNGINYQNVNEPQLQLGNPNFAVGFNLSN